uniref:Uncharacterized protein n=1 Tax=Solanum tuberosum TaxID=4113 RepID=M1CUG5_SOLTU
MKLDLDWWKPTTRCWPEEITRDWVCIRLLALPMNLWSKKFFQDIGNLCGGYIDTEEETSLKNHLHWARINVRGDGSAVPKEVEVTSDGFTFIGDSSAGKGTGTGTGGRDEGGRDGTGDGAGGIWPGPGLGGQK